MKYGASPSTFYAVRYALCSLRILNPQSEIRNLKSVMEACVGERSLNTLHFKGDSVEFGCISACRGKLPWIDGKCFSNPIEVSAREFG